MTRLLSIAEKTIAGLLIIWAGLVFYFYIGGVWTLFEMGIIQPMALLDVFKNYHLIFLLPVLTLFGGLFLLLGKKIGWTVSLIALILNVFFFLIPVERGKNIFDDKISILLFTCLTFLSLSMFCILVLPAYRNKYSVTSINWWTVAFIGLLLFLDKTLLYLTS